MSLSEVIPYTPALFSGILRRGSRSWRVAVVRDEECTVVVGKSEARYHSEDLVVDGRIILTLRLLMSYIYIYIYIYEAAGRSPAEIVGSNPTGGMDICCECRVLSGRGLCDELITRPEESYRLWYVAVCDLETSRICAPYIYIYIYIYI